MLRVYIPARGASVSRVVFNQESAKFSSLEYDAVVPASVKASTRINALAGVVHTLSQFKEKGVKGISVIFTVGLVADAIQRGTFKYWLESGENNAGEKLHETEMDLWKQFAELYQEMFLSIVFKNISSATLPRNTRFSITNEMRIDDKYSRIAWDKLPEVGEAEEVEGDAF
ncbi:hypothetical protein [Bacillus atrophaeus]|uniref:hypothetical protein n=1 Tax=Bacillus atrophaeus TaxID=1452 RepID=UPI00227FA916|nr:hypothetical protein [Bacillus atrophaeus]MCY7866077.1 hypothetical protein [Bacillus spizizenii]MCY8890359.1 hypothetical protein [Bacillus spizizenii]MEC0842083.1 hypothetical protein [Bacillus spizizenii]MED1125299.1 hypothetical protein [Bacillus atrophaeus]